MTAELVEVTLKLDPIVLVLLQALATHLGKTRDEVVADALRWMFVVLPRPGDGSRTP